MSNDKADGPDDIKVTEMVHELSTEVLLRDYIMPYGQVSRRTCCSSSWGLVQFCLADAGFEGVEGYLVTDERPVCRGPCGGSVCWCGSRFLARAFGQTHLHPLCTSFALHLLCTLPLHTSAPSLRHPSAPSFCTSPLHPNRQIHNARNNLWFCFTCSFPIRKHQTYQNINICKLL